MKSHHVSVDKSGAGNFSKTRMTIANFDNATLIGSGIGSFDNETDNFYSDYKSN